MKGDNLLDAVLSKEEYIQRKIDRQSEGKIAFDFHVSEHTLERWRTKMNIRRSDVNQKRYQLIKAMLDKGMDMHQIALELKITRRQCYNILKQHQEQ